MPTVLINADDFGLHRDIDRGILQCVDAGSVRSLSYCANGISVDWPALRRLAAAGLKTGLHVTLVGEPWLVDRRVYKNWKSLVAALLLSAGGLRRDIRKEIAAQLDAGLQNGISPSHIDSHQHVHAFPGVWEECLRVARERDIRIRVPAAPNRATAKHSAAGRVLQALAARAGKSVSHLPCLGIARAGHNTADIFLQELAASKGRDVELVVHPAVDTPDLRARYGAWNFDWEAERSALTSPLFLDAVAARGVRNDVA